MSHPWLIVPVKPFAEGKSRLSEELPPAERARLSRRLLHHVLTTAAIDGLFMQTIVVSRDPGAAEIAEEYGATLLAEEGGELNAALEQARELALRQGASAILVLPADLPQLSADDLAKLVQYANAAPSMIIAPSRDGGTNALLLRPPRLIPFAFGVDSFAQHLTLARRAGISPVVVNTPTLAFDLDSPSDLQELLIERGFDGLGGFPRIEYPS